jgi:predicted ester cyclase
VAANPQPYRIEKETRPAPVGSPDAHEPEGVGFDIAHFITNAWDAAWNRRMFDRFAAAYLSTVRCHAAAGRELFGQGEVVQNAIDMLACFPDGWMTFDHFCALGSEDEGFRTSLRWTLRGTHTGYGQYGEPTGKPVKIMGITHSQVEAGKIVEEWTLFDELSIMCQLVTHHQQTLPLAELPAKPE